MKKLAFLLFTSILLGACKTQKIEPIASNNIVSVDKRPQSVTVTTISDSINKSVYSLLYNADSLLVRIQSNKFQFYSQKVDAEKKFKYENGKLVREEMNYYKADLIGFNFTKDYTYENNKIKSIIYNTKNLNQKIITTYKNDKPEYITIITNTFTQDSIHIDSIAISFQPDKPKFCKTFLYKNINKGSIKLSDSTVYTYSNNLLQIDDFEVNNNNIKNTQKYYFIDKKIDLPNQLDLFLKFKNQLIVTVGGLNNLGDIILGDIVPLNYCISYQSIIGFEVNPAFTYSFKFDSLDRLVEISDSDSKTVLSY